MTKPTSLYAVEVTPVAEAAARRTTPCPVCGHDVVHSKYRIEGLTSLLAECPVCGLGRLDPLPDAQEVQSYYGDAYYGDTGRKFESVIEWLVRVVAARQARFLTRGLRPGARVLDVGCGRGVMLRAFANRGLEVHGTEISAAAAQGADPRAIVHIGERLEEVGFPDAYFDEVVLWHVFEHLRDPRETVREVHRILRPGGRLVLAVPNLASWQARITGAGWFHLDPPRHLYHYPLTALRQLVEQADFTCSAVHHFSLRQNPFGWLQSVLNRFTSLPRNGLYVMLHRADHGPKPFTRPIRWMFRAAFYAGMPVAVVLSVCEALCGHGGTVTLVATRASGSHATQDGRHTLSTPPAAH